MESQIGDSFQQQTKYFPGKLTNNRLLWSEKPEKYKTYQNVNKIKLPLANNLSKCSFEEALVKRKSIRRYSTIPLSLEMLSYLLWASTGIQRIEGEFEFRTAPSAGALYPIETYIIVNNVTGLSMGVYHYSIGEHLLEELKTGDYRNKIANAALGQEMCCDAAVVFIWTALFARSKWKYGQRAYRYIYLDAGHIAQNLALAATGINLGSCQIAALFDDVSNELLDIDGETESVIYMTSLGSLR